MIIYLYTFIINHLNQPMLFGGINRDQSFDQCWGQLPVGYKIFFLTTLVFNAVGLLFQSLLYYTTNIPYFTIFNLQLWRVLITFLPAGFQFTAFLNILLNFYFMLSLWPEIQKKMSTSYMILEILMQNLLIQSVFTALSVILYMLNLVSSPYSLFSMGWFPLVMIFIFQRASLSPDDLTTFCCMPCLIKMKYIPFIILALSLFFSPTTFVSLLVASLLGYLQFIRFKRRFLKLPLSIYRRLDRILPESLTKRPDFIKVSQSQAYLKSQCYKGSPHQQRQNGNNNPFDRGNHANQQGNNEADEPNKVQVMGKGVSIGGSNVSDFRGIWAQKQARTNSNRQQFQIQPKLQQQGIYQNQNRDQSKQLQMNLFQNDSNINLVKQKNQDDQESVQELTEPQKQTTGKKGLLD